MVPWAVVPESPEVYCLLSLPVCVCVRVCFVQRRVPVTKTRRPSPASRAMVDRPRLRPTCNVSQPFDHQRGTPDDRPAAPSHPAPACLSVHLSAFRPVGAGRFRSRRRRAPLRGPPRPGTVSSVAAATSLSLSAASFRVRTSSQNCEKATHFSLLATIPLTGGKGEVVAAHPSLQFVAFLRSGRASLHRMFGRVQSRVAVMARGVGSLPIRCRYCP